MLAQKRQGGLCLDRVLRSDNVREILKRAKTWEVQISAKTCRLLNLLAVLVFCVAPS